MRYFLMICTLIVGSLIPLQALLNTRLGARTGGPIIGAMLSFFVGLICLIVLNLFVNPTAVGQLRQTTGTPWYFWLGGVVGAIFVGYITWVNQQQGVALTFALVVSGQILISLFIDHYGLLGSTVRTITLEKIIGAALIVGGLILVKK